jgi:hypothetical protein
MFLFDKLCELYYCISVISTVKGGFDVHAQL